MRSIAERPSKSTPTPRFTKRYKSLPEGKSKGITYTPKVLADFVAEQIVNVADLGNLSGPLHILDPAVGDGELLLSLLGALATRSLHDIVIYGFDTAESALSDTKTRLVESFPDAALCLKHDSFLNFVAAYGVDEGLPSLFRGPDVQRFDLVIANPPYVRTQIIGANVAQKLASSFKLNGRVDLYHAFLIAIAQVLKPTGTAGVIVSNRFMTTKGGASLRRALRDRLALKHVWDLGDTKLFDAAVLPAVILAQGLTGTAPSLTAFTSIYETSEAASTTAANPIEALAASGTIELSDLRRFRVQHGTLDNTGPSHGIWRLATDASDSWLASVQERQWGTFREIGKIRVGVKTCADGVFIRDDWDQLDLLPELLRPVTTHHIARRYKPLTAERPKAILYPHEVAYGRRQPVDISKYPNSKAYLEGHRSILERREYVIEGGRRWYEIWVPQDPAAWSQPKLVFRDISERPTFWLDLAGTIVNGDCYWLIAQDPPREHLLWLAAAIANSTFAEAFYDRRFNNKLYSGRRRFITQYVEQFPLPDPSSAIAKEIIEIARELYVSEGAPDLEARVDALVWDAFGLIKESGG